MVKTQINVEYLKQVDKIKEFLKFTRLSAKSQKTKFLALDKFFPFLVDFFEVVENFDLTEYLSKKNNETNEIKEKWLEEGVVNKVFEEWGNLDAEKRADLLMMWIDKQETNIQNTYLNYLWRIQGLLKKVNKEWQANPENMDKIKSNGLHLDEDENITLVDVGELYNKLSPKYKMILKMMVYTGLNPADLVELKPIDFHRVYDEEKYGNNAYYYVNKDRIKGRHKNVVFLQVYTESFMKEIIAYFEIEKILKYNKTKQAKKVEQLKKDPRFEVVKEYKNFIEFNGKRNWKKDKNENIFGNIKSSAISDAFRYHNNGNKGCKVQPSSIRRLCFTRLAPLFSQTQEDKDIYNLWTQHKTGIMASHYMTKLISNIIIRLEKNDIQGAILLGNMGDYIKETITLRKKFDDIETLKIENKELRAEINNINLFLSRMSNVEAGEVFTFKGISDDVKEGKPIKQPKEAPISYECGICEEVFKTKKEIRDHELKEHGKTYY